MGFSKVYKPSPKQKSRLLKMLDKLPQKYGYLLYHKIQSLYNKHSLDYKIKSTKNSFNVINRILGNQGLSMTGATCIEMGSGWLPIFPYLLLLEGKAGEVLTYDINNHYQASVIKQLNTEFSKRYADLEFTGDFHLLNGVGYFPKSDIGSGRLNSANFIFSRFVLEHVPPEVIASLHDAFYEKLPDEAYILHMISPSDHRAYGNDELSLYDFLKFSQEEWDTIQTKFDYHNRLRLPQYISLFEKRFEIVFMEHQSCKEGTPQYDKFKELKIHHDFASYSDDELTAGSINVLLKKKT